MVDGISCSAPSTYVPLQAQENQVNYTAMLMVISHLFHYEISLHTKVSRY
jgi:hypothetical protein